MTHEEKVKKLLEEFNSIKGEVILAKETSNLYRNPENATARLNVKNFTEVLSVKNGIAEVEGMIEMEKLANATLKHGFVPEVVVDLKSITAGGAVSGIAIESSSFRHGLFHETVEEMEVLTPNGEIVICTKDKNSDLFYALPNSYGTLGYILRLKIRLKKAGKFVKITHVKYQDPEKCFEDLEMFSKNGEQDFVDGVVFDRNSQVITLGEFTDEAPYVSNYKYMNIYYKSLLSKDEDYLTIYDYLFRWDADWWWGSQNTPLKNPIFRLIFGKFLLNTRSYMFGMRIVQKYGFLSKFLLKESEKEVVIQDIGIAKEYWKKYLDFLLNEIKILPIWLCSFKGSSKYPLFESKDELYIDFGFWGFAPSKSKDYEWNKLVDRKTHEMNGIKSLYSEVKYTEEDFWKNIDRIEYEKVKSKYDPQGKFKSLYEKVTNR